MLYRFLRQYLHDEEFEQTKFQLQESQDLLAEYRRYIEKEKEAVSHEKEKVDPDFLVFVWATIGFSLAILLEGMKTLVELKAETSTPSFWIWVVITLFSVFFAAHSGTFALDLTEKYASSKSDKNYLTYARLLIVGALMLTISVFVLGYLGK